MTATKKSNLKTTTGKAADRETARMVRDAKDGKGSITYTPKNDLLKQIERESAKRK